MDWLQGMQMAIAYIEDNLTEEIDMEETAKCAYSSSFHFQRMFGILTGISLGEYIRNRRLTRAGQELAMSKEKVTEIAFKYGYETSEAFTRAFTRFHGITPSAAREPGASLKSCGKLSIHITMKGGKEMKYRLVDLEAFSVVGVKKSVVTENNENLKVIPAFWTECMKSGTWEILCELAKDTSTGVMGICANFGKGEFDYYIAARQKNSVPVGMETLQIPKNTWAVFEAVGQCPQAIQDVWERIWSEWFPTSGYECTSDPELEVYYEGDTQAADYKSEVWIPVKKK